MKITRPINVATTTWYNVVVLFITVNNSWKLELLITLPYIMSLLTARGSTRLHFGTAGLQAECLYVDMLTVTMLTCSAGIMFTMFTILVLHVGMQGITKVIKIHPKGNMNVCTKVQDNLSNSQDFSLKTTWWLQRKSQGFNISSVDH